MAGALNNYNSEAGKPTGIFGAALTESDTPEGSIAGIFTGHPRILLRRCRGNAPSASRKYTRPGPR